MADANPLAGLPDPEEQGISKNEKKRRLKAVQKAKAAAVRAPRGCSVCRRTRTRARVPLPPRRSVAEATWARSAAVVVVSTVVRAYHGLSYVFAPGWSRLS